MYPRSDLDLAEVVFEPPAGTELVQFARGTVVFSHSPCEPQVPRPLSSTAYLEEKRAINHTAALWAILRQESKDQAIGSVLWPAIVAHSILRAAFASANQI